MDLSDAGIFPKSNFNTPLNAFLTVLILLMDEGWTEIYQDHYRATESFGATFFFSVIVILGQFVLLNLFIAIMIENFEQLSVRNDLTNKLNMMKKRTLWYEKFKKMFIDPCLPRLRIRPSFVTSTRSQSVNFKELD